MWAQTDDTPNMKAFCLILNSLIIAVGPVVAGEMIELGPEAAVPLPDGWILSDETTDFPFQLIESTLGAEVLIFKSIITAEEAIRNEVDLQNSVESIADDIIPNLPQSQLLSSYGYYEQNRARFVLEFRSVDTAQDLMLRHRMAGILYRHPDGHQLLFTLWGKSPTDLYSRYEPALKMVQSGFAYRGPFEPEVFGEASPFPWYALLALMAIIGLLYTFRAFRSRHDRVQLSTGQGFWRCGECGRLNPALMETCRRCGKPKVTADQV